MNVRGSNAHLEICDVDPDGDLAWAVEGVDLEWMCVP
jgi:hypothetical protein